MPNEGNLKHDRSPSEARENGARGGRASGAARRAKRDAKDAAILFLNLAATTQLDENLTNLNVKTADRTNLMGIIARHCLKAQSGDVGSARFLMEIAGYMQKTGEGSVNVNIGKDDEQVVIILPDNGRD